MEDRWTFSSELEIDPQELKDTHNKIYTEKSVHQAIKNFQYENKLESFSEAGRLLWLIALVNLQQKQKEG